MLAEQMAGLIAGAPLRTLDDVSRDVWRALSAGMLTDDQAQGLAEAIHARRTRARTGPQPASPDGKRTWSYFPPKRPQRSPDRERSLYRRRQLAASGPMPPALACCFTTGELAVLRIVADQVQRSGVCGLSIPEIAARAGVGQTKARMAIREAERLGLVTVEERRQHCRPNLPNLVRIVSREWLAWISKRRSTRDDQLHNLGVNLIRSQGVRRGVTQRTANPCTGVGEPSLGLANGVRVRCSSPLEPKSNGTGHSIRPSGNRSLRSSPPQGSL